MKWAQKLGKKMYKVCWVDVNQGDDTGPKYRSRLACCELKAGMPNIELYAATPPLYFLKALLSCAVTDLHASGRVLKILFIDIRRAFFCATATDWVFIELVKEDQDSEKDEIGVMEPGKGVGMYGTRLGAKNWQMKIIEIGVEKLDFEPGLSSPCLLCRGNDDVKVMVH